MTKSESKNLRIDSPKVSDLLTIHNSPKWMLRYTAFRLSNDGVVEANL